LNFLRPPTWICGGEKMEKEKVNERRMKEMGSNCFGLPGHWGLRTDFSNK